MYKQLHQVRELSIKISIDLEETVILLKRLILLISFHGMSATQCFLNQIHFTLFDELHVLIFFCWQYQLDLLLGSLLHHACKFTLPTFIKLMIIFWFPLMI
jgi:hypothetical protein